MYTLGIDAHERESQVAVLDEDGEIVREVRVQNANLDDFGQEYAGADPAIEATGNYYTIYDTLDEHLDVTVADRNQTKAIRIAEIKNNRLNAKLLAQLRRAEMIADSYVPPDEICKRRSLVRASKRLVEKRTEFKNEVHTLLNKHRISLDKNVFSAKGREVLAGEDFALDRVSETFLKSYLSIIDELTAQIEAIKDMIEEFAASPLETQLLMTIRGISFYSSLWITAEIGEIDRFNEAGGVVSYAGLDPIVRESWEFAD